MNNEHTAELTLFKAIRSEAIEKRINNAIVLIQQSPQVVNVHDRFGATLLNIAARAGSEEMFGCLVSHGAKVNLSGLQAYDVLQYSTSKGTPKMVKFALESGLDPNHDREVFDATRNEKGYANEILQIMLEHGLRINRVFAMFGDRNNAKTALDYAGEQSEVGKFLRSKGAKTAREVLEEDPNVEVLGAEVLGSDK